MTTPSRIDIEVSYRSDPVALKNRLRRSRHDVEEVTIRLDSSFCAEGEPDNIEWQYPLLQAIGSGLSQTRTIKIQGPACAAHPLHLHCVTRILEFCAGVVHLDLSSLKLKSWAEQDELAFWAVLEQQVSLEEFRMSGVWFHNVESRLMRLLATLPNLKVVAIRATNSVSETVPSLFASHSLQKVVLFSTVLCDEASQALLAALEQNTSVREASLGLTCGASGGPALQQMLQNNHTLEKLWIRINSLESDHDNQRIAQALRTAGHLLEFGLYGEKHVSAASEEFFVDVLRTDNMKLKVLELQTPERISEEMHYLLLLNEVGREELLHGAPPRQSWIQAIVNTRHDLNCLFYLLHANPMLCSSEI
ncbi:expressed unknown protein [Seminavis robusta]|uniref:Uncharacterized protein n=1 Tax=Seminavis robusta TaxID=568900 RepID=A0A9N8HB47_9STRA|nr:expressed unknown protein [Seminavis robusta]|eukprot:Sro347_g123050.1 n/a (363) ;mRNA; f:60030-61118